MAGEMKFNTADERDMAGERDIAGAREREYSRKA